MAMKFSLPTNVAFRANTLGQVKRRPLQGAADPARMYRQITLDSAEDQARTIANGNDLHVQ
jgi:hypothetical protein